MLLQKSPGTETWKLTIEFVRIHDVHGATSESQSRFCTPRKIRERWASRPVIRVAVASDWQHDLEIPVFLLHLFKSGDDTTDVFILFRHLVGRHRAQLWSGNIDVMIFKVCIWIWEKTVFGGAHSQLMHITYSLWFTLKVRDHGDPCMEHIETQKHSFEQKDTKWLTSFHRPLAWRMHKWDEWGTLREWTSGESRSLDR